VTAPARGNLSISKLKKKKERGKYVAQGLEPTCHRADKETKRGVKGKVNWHNTTKIRLVKKPDLRAQGTKGGDDHVLNEKEKVKKAHPPESREKEGVCLRPEEEKGEMGRNLGWKRLLSQGRTSYRCWGEGGGEISLNYKSREKPAECDYP